MQLRGLVPSVLTGMVCAGCLSAPDGGRVLISEDFSSGMSNWWVEGGEKVWLEDGRLHMKADPGKRAPGHVCTAWHRQPISGNVRIEFDAHVVSSTLDANNINFFFFYSDPSGEPLYESRDTRKEADYQAYHDLNGYIVTFLKDFHRQGGEREDGGLKARYRLRRCPGFNLLTETFDSHCEAGVTYHCEIVRQGGRLTFAVDGKVYLEHEDPEPLREGLIGLRTFRTYLWWDNIRVTQLP